MLTRLILLASLVLQFFLPWWIICPVAFLFAAFRAKSASHAFQSGFKAVALLWTIMSLIKSLPNNNVLANRVGQMFMLPDWSFNWIFLVIVSALIGGLVAGLSALSGHLWRGVLRKQQ